MPALKYAKPERIWLKDHPELDERWLQDRIGEDCNGPQKLDRKKAFS